MWRCCMIIRCLNSHCWFACDVILRREATYCHSESAKQTKNLGRMRQILRFAQDDMPNSYHGR
jgi:hypothetical protein